MKHKLVLMAFTSFTALLAIEPTAYSADDRIGGIQLLPGYKHEKLQGIDSVVGRIVNPKGLTIHYDIGGIPKGAIRFGGSFIDRPVKTPPAQLRWFKQQMVQGEPVHIAYLKNDTLLVSFPKSLPGKGINFSAKVKTPDEMADVLLMLLTFPHSQAAKKK